MVSTNSLHEQLQQFAQNQKTALRALWEELLASEWSGQTYNDFVLLKWLETKREMGFHHTRVTLLNLIHDKAVLQMENLGFRMKLKNKVSQAHRKKQYRNIVFYNRKAINAYNDLKVKILGGVPKGSV